jgi:hypothetical protein
MYAGLVRKLFTPFITIAAAIWSIAAQAQVEVVFGPKDFRGQLNKPSWQFDSFNVSNPGLSPARIVIVNGGGALPAPEDCPQPTIRELFRFLECRLQNALTRAQDTLTRVQSLEVEFNGALIVRKGDFSHTTDQRTVACANSPL